MAETTERNLPWKCVFCRMDTGSSVLRAPLGQRSVVGRGHEPAGKQLLDSWVRAGRRTRCILKDGSRPKEAIEIRRRISLVSVQSDVIRSQRIDRDQDDDVSATRADSLQHFAAGARDKQQPQQAGCQQTSSQS